MMNHLSSFRIIFALLRPAQWAKNVFVFLPLFFDKQLGNMDLFIDCIIAFIAFSLASSSIYCFNDIYDVEADRLHPVKCKRPIASGMMSTKQGYGLMILCLLLSVSFLLVCEREQGESMLAVILTYYLLNIGYCMKLKQIAIVDVFIIATGFVLRVWIGGIATGIVLSQWIVLMTFLLALFLAFAKRRDDVVIYASTGVKARRNISCYNPDFMNQVLTIIGTITIVCYIMYTVSAEVTMRLGSHSIYLTSVFVLAGIIRYLQLTLVYTRSGSPTNVLMTDRFIQLCILGWVIFFVVIIYL